MRSFNGCQRKHASADQRRQRTEKYNDERKFESLKKNRIREQTRRTSFDRTLYRNRYLFANERIVFNNIHNKKAIEARRILFDLVEIIQLFLGGCKDGICFIFVALCHVSYRRFFF
jgi:hypothetical protein